MFLARNFFWGAPPEFLEWDYKIQPDSDHVAKFQVDRSRELGERVAKQKKDTSRVKHKPVRNGCSGRPKNIQRVQTSTKSGIVNFAENAYFLPKGLMSDCQIWWWGNLKPQPSYYRWTIFTFSLRRF